MSTREASARFVFQPDQRVRAKLLNPFVGRVHSCVHLDTVNPGNSVYAVTAPAEWCVRNHETVIQNVNARNLEALDEAATA